MNVMNCSKIILLLILIPSTALGMWTTFQSPTPCFPQPRYARNNLTSWELIFYSNKASESYNSCGQIVPLLNFAKSQDLFKNFVDSSLPYNDQQTFGKAYLPATYACSNYGFKLIQNIGSNFFLHCATKLSNENLKNITIQPIHANGIPLTPQEINADPALKIYLTKLNKIIGIDDACSTISNTFIGQSFLTLGYTKSLQDFTSIDFIDFSIQAGILIPEINLDQQNKILSVFQYNKTINFGIPILASCAVGMYDWLNIGVSGMIMPFINNDQIIPLNTTPTHNLLLVSHHGLCSVHQEPLIYFNTYLEAERLIPGLTLLAGLSYAKQHKTCFQSQDQNTFPNNLINAYPTKLPWEILDTTFSCELDLATDDAKMLPRIKFVYVMPLWGKSIFKTSTISGQIGLEIVYDF